MWSSLEDQNWNRAVVAKEEEGVVATMADIYFYQVQCFMFNEEYVLFQVLL